MATPFFIAEAPTVTILRSLASSAYGSYTLNLPDGIDLEDVTDLDAPGNTLGYVASLQRGKRVGGLARSFIRADVTVTAADASDPDVTPESDVHDVLDEARSRVSSDFFLESDITKAGMGAWIPYVDFNVGDRANISVLDHVVNLPITRIESQVTDHSDTDFLVHVGGQLVSDEQARMAENMSLEKKFLQDRRELAGIEAATKQAQKTADSAQSTANTAESIADSARSDLDGTEVEAVEEAWNPEGEGWAGAVETLNRNFIEFRAFQIDTNDAIQERVTAHGLMIEDLQEAKRRALASISRTVISFGARQSDPDAEFIRASIVGDTVYVVALGDWKGTVAVEVISSLSIEGTRFQQPTHFWLTIPDVSFGRSWSQSFTGINIAPVSVMATANIQPGIMREERLPINHFLPDRDRWVTVKSFVAQETSLHTILGEVGWHSTTYNDTYGARLMIGDREIARDGPRVRVGPIAFWQDGYRKWVLDKRDIQVTEGEEIRLEVWAGATGTDQRTVRDGELRVWWIDDGDE